MNLTVVTNNNTATQRQNAAIMAEVKDRKIEHKLYGWQLPGRTAMRAARRTLPHRQYRLRVKCGPARMQATEQATAVGQKEWGHCAPLHGRGSWDSIQHVAWAEAYLCTKWYLDPSSHLATIDWAETLGGIFSIAKNVREAPNNKCYREWATVAEKLYNGSRTEGQKSCVAENLALLDKICISAYHL